MIRLLDPGLMEPWMTVAVDEALALSRQKRCEDTLHLYVRDRPTISLGYFQDPQTSVDMEAVDRHGVSLVRRMSGGSAIYTDSDQLIYSLVTEPDRLPDRDLSFRLVCGALVSALGSLGIDAEYKHPNDVLVNGRKVSGSAQARCHGAVVIHGTIVLDVDLDMVSCLLRPRERSEPMSYLGMSSLKREHGPLSMDNLKRSVTKAFSEAFGEEIVPGALTTWERDTADTLCRQRYSDPKYTRSISIGL